MEETARERAERSVTMEDYFDPMNQLSNRDTVTELNRVTAVLEMTKEALEQAQNELQNMKAKYEDMQQKYITMMDRLVSMIDKYTKEN